MVIKQIPFAKEYAVSDEGEVYSLRNQKLEELKKDISNGYPRVKLNGKKYYVAALVAERFLPIQPDSNYKIFYVDGNKLNCNKENLVWLDQSDIQRYSQYTVEYRRQVLGEWA